MKQKILLTSLTCGPCYALKNKLKTLNIQVETKDYTIPEDRELFIKHNIKSVPRLLVIDGDNIEVVQGTEEIIEAIKDA